LGGGKKKLKGEGLITKKGHRGWVNLPAEWFAQRGKCDVKFGLRDARIKGLELSKRTNHVVHSQRYRTSKKVRGNLSFPATLKKNWGGDRVPETLRGKRQPSRPTQTGHKMQK